MSNQKILEDLILHVLWIRNIKNRKLLAEEILQELREIGEKKPNILKFSEQNVTTALNSLIEKQLILCDPCTYLYSVTEAGQELADKNYYEHLFCC